MNKKILITHLTRMRYPYICITGIDIELFKNLKSGICLPENQPGELRPMLQNNQKWNIDDHGLIELYNIYEFEGNYASEDNSKEDFYIHSYKIFEEKYVIQNLIKDFIKICQNHKLCCSASKIYDSLIIHQQKSFIPFSTLQESLGCVEGYISNIYLKGNQWRCNFNMETWGGEPGYIGDLPITDIRFYDAMNRFNPNNLDKIKKIFTFDYSSYEGGCIKGLISIGLSREFREKRWLQINTIHPEDYFLKDSKDSIFPCPLCSSEIVDHRKSKPSALYPNFRCSNEECDQGNGHPWSSWEEELD